MSAVEESSSETLESMTARKVDAQRKGCQVSGSQGFEGGGGTAESDTRGAALIARAFDLWTGG